MKRPALLLLCLVCLACLALSAPGCIVVPVGDLLKGPSLGEQVLLQGGGFWSEEKIAIVEVDGMIRGEEGPSALFPQENTVSEVKARLGMARRDPDVRAVVLRVSSPGGEVTACDVLHQEIRRFKEQKKVPVIASIGDQGASGGYYVSVAADTIFASPTSVVGSIGVLLQHLDLSDLLSKIGVAFAPVKSAEKKDLGSPFRRMTEDERRVLQKLVDDMYQRFIDVVDEGREPLRRDEVAALADGRVVSGSEAASLKLVDRVGYLADAIEEARVRAGIESPTIVRYTRVPRSGANIYTGLEAPRPEASAVRLDLCLAAGEGPKLYYLWRPGW
ncbi:MAG: signal peptide peptidase SppA [Planctomycetes bacterium]|nr:signal peptide peptidase SppA [Planctomycetota bacterium]